MIRLRVLSVLALFLSLGLVSSLEISAVQAGSPVFVKVATGALSASGTSVTASITPSAAGDFLFVGIWSGGAPTVLSIVDTQANVFVFQLTETQSGGFPRGTVYTVASLNSVAADTVTVTFSGSVFGAGVQLAEYSGVSGIGATNGSFISSTDTPSLSLVTTTAGSLIVGHDGNRFGGSGGGSITPSAGQTQHGFLSLNACCNIISDLEDRSTTTAGSYSFSVTISPGGFQNTSMILVELKGQPPPPGFPTDLLWVKSLAAVIMIGFLILPAYRWKTHEGGAGNAPSFFELAVDTVIVCGAFLVIIGAL